MSFTEFMNKYNGKFVDFDGVYGAQCMDLMHQYIRDVLGLSDGRILAAPGAKDVFLNFDNLVGHDQFEKIPNTPTGIPKEGDIVLWGTKIGPYGHVAIFVEGDENKFSSFDENWPVGSPCHVQAHSYNGCLGWLRTKGVQPDLQTENDKLRIDRDKNWNMFVDLCNALGVAPNKDIAIAEINKLVVLEDAVVDKDKKLIDAEKKIADLETKIKDLTQVNENLLKEDADLKSRIEEQEQTIKKQGFNIQTLTENINDLKAAIKLPIFKGWKKKLVDLLSRL